MKFVFSMTLALALLASAPALADGRIDVMTQNQYLGADLDPIIQAPDLIAFNTAVLEALSEVAANDFETRAGLLAKLIANRLPDLVGLQEVFSFGCIDLSAQTGFGCNDYPIDGAFNNHLTKTLAALNALDEPYRVAAQVQNLFLEEIPVDTDFNGVQFIPDILVTVLDRDVILARDDIPDQDVAPVPFSLICARPSLDGGPGCNYQAVAKVDAAVGEITIERGWVGVDAEIDGKVYRFVNTHLEVQNLLGVPPGPVIPFASIQAFQATELNAMVDASLMFIANQTTDQSATPSPIIVGDINSGPTDGIFFDPFFPDFPDEPYSPPYAELRPPYMQFANGMDIVGSPSALGPLTDGWTVTGNIPGFSCCQESDLSNHSSILDERIDVIFSLEEPNKAKKKRVLGSKVPDKSAPDGLWPSDHGSVAAQLEFY